MEKNETAGSGHLEALSEISEAITSTTYLDDILRLVVVVTAKVMESNICSLMLLNEQTGELEIRATQAVSEAYLEKPPVRLGEGISGQAAKENRPVDCWDVKKDDRYINKEVAVKENLCSLLSMPMSIKERVLGVINCYTSVPHEFTRDEKTILSTVANQAAMAIENTDLVIKSKLMEEELEARKLIERAKDILMDERGISGYEAFTAIRRKSMDSRRPIREIAEAIILANEVGKA
ncbi:MAG: GAF and ANTAR domain-containing protein [Actinobacteria bacterium]|nr:GAF and ANTAR domain-containing protein [Actinomycetota bacterium]MCG2819272.1 GAF and ANTAR domain-containing protein [Actinomycetes bacterium]